MDEAFSWVPRRLLSATTDAADLTPGQVALYACICLLFVCGSGMAAGLTLGLMSLDKIEMEVLMRSGSAKEQALARRILPLISDPHWLLVTLLLCNAGCFEALPIFLDILVDPVGAILISVTLILIFGEILPQAVCARHGLAIGAACSWLVLGLKWLTCPVSWPLARALDLLLGKEGHNMFKRKQLKTLIDLHGADEGLGGKLTDDEVQIICGALDLTSKIAYSAMTPLDKVVMLSHDAQLDRPAILQLLASGHSRVPVFSAGRRQQVVGLLLVKELLQYAFEMLADSGGGEGRVLRVADLKLRSLPRLSATTPMYDMLKLFQTGRAHMALLTQPEAGQGPGGALLMSAATSPRPPPHGHPTLKPGRGEQQALTPTSDRLPAAPPQAGPPQPMCPAGLPLPSTPAAAHLGLGAGPGQGRLPAVLLSTAAAGHEGGRLGQGGHRGNGRPADPPTPHHAAATHPLHPHHHHHHHPHSHHSQDAEQQEGGRGAAGPPPEGCVSLELGGGPVGAPPRLPRAVLQLALPAGGEAAPLLDQEEGGGGLQLPGALGGSRTASLTRFNQGEGGAGDPSLRKGPLGRLSARLAGSLHRHHSSSSDFSHSSHSSSDTESEGAQVEVPDLALPGEPIGIITIEDVIEELMGQEILDETDHFADNECTMEVNDEMRAQMARNLPDRIKHVLMAGINAGGSGRGLIMRRLSHLSRHSRQSNPNSVALSRSSTPPPTATDMRLSGSQRTLVAMSAGEAGAKGQGLP